MIETSSGAGMSALVKIYGFKVLGGVLAVAISFAFLWPKTAKEGVTRIGCTILGSILFGSTLLNWVYATLPFWPHDHEAAMPVYVAAGLPMWWALGWVFHYLDARKAKDFAEIIKEVKQ